MASIIKSNNSTHEQLALSEERYTRLLNILQYESKNQQDLLDYAMHEAIALTQSKLGYIYHYSETNKEFTLNTWSRDVMKACTITKPKTTYKLSKTGIWGEVVRQHKAIIVNDFAKPNKLKKGYPKGHAALFKFMSIPILEHDEIVAVVGLANKETDYTNEDQKQLELFMAAVWLIFNQKKTEEELKNKTTELEKMNSLMIDRELKMVELKEALMNSQIRR